MNQILEIYGILLKEFKEQGWWPVFRNYFPNYIKPENNKEILEICLGAILTQNTSWKNVEKALDELRKDNLIDLDNLKKIDVNKLALIIKSSGYNNQKARKIKEFIKFLVSGKKINRENLLGVWGIGYETADSILLYAYKKPVFVIDAYTKRIMNRIGFKEDNYSDSQELFMNNLEKDLNGKKKAVQYTVEQKAVILAQTKNKEQAFKELVKTKEEQKAQFEKDVYEFEAQLNLTIDKGSYPVPRNGILFWPLDDVFITQKFGKTVGAEKLYVSGSHNGLDFRASVGTRVKRVLDGVGVGTGNTDIYPGCYSFGKWVMVKHGDGLSTIYGHLSVISVNTGQELQTGDLIGYSGNSGYSTGPHLHLGLYATQGVRIEQFVQSRGCKQAIIPLADIKAYLDPLAYLPVL